jgi:large subunit ribosomal protein L18
MSKKELSRNEMRKKRHRRIRAKIIGRKTRPRVSVYKSLKHLYIQFIDDIKGETLLGLSDKALDKKSQKLPKMKRAVLLSKLLAKMAKKKGIKKVVFDRGGYPYKGIVKEIAETLRSEGLKF